jgi:hypothetical protein
MNALLAVTPPIVIHAQLMSRREPASFALSVRGRMSDVLETGSPQVLSKTKAACAAVSTVDSVPPYVLEQKAMPPERP